MYSQANYSYPYNGNTQNLPCEEKFNYVPSDVLRRGLAGGQYRIVDAPPPDAASPHQYGIVREAEVIRESLDCLEKELAALYERIRFVLPDTEPSGPTTEPGKDMERPACTQLGRELQGIRARIVRISTEVGRVRELVSL